MDGRRDGQCDGTGQKPKSAAHDDHPVASVLGANVAEDLMRRGAATALVLTSRLSTLAPRPAAASAIEDRNGRVRLEPEPPVGTAGGHAS